MAIPAMFYPCMSANAEPKSANTTFLPCDSGSEPANATFKTTDAELKTANTGFQAATMAMEQMT